VTRIGGVYATGRAISVGGAEISEFHALPELQENVEHMILDGAFGRPERLGNLAIAVTAGHQAKRLDFAPAEALWRVDRLELLGHLARCSQDPLGNRGTHERAAGRDLANGAREIVERHVSQQEPARP
jgi:hypothetical protein